ncbi:unnamed protein product [Mytilus coruscus]|uniref:Uncharacterized protein n=1 Tax=Mytilus coruscus TaxID=42192 RepID=A0A6J8CGV7_MYTCO|nr:unnamed protein product [Mytilus coruscus]
MMEPEIEALCKQMSKDRFKRLLEDMQGMQEEWLDPEVDISKQNKYGVIFRGESSDPSDYIKPIYLTDTDVFGSVKPPRPLWLTNIEIYNAIDTKIPAERIKGIQRIRDMWRIYMDNEEDKLSLQKSKTTDANSNNANKPNSTKPGKGKVSVNETNSSNSDKGQSYIDKFMNTPQSQRRNLSQHHTPPTPPENLHDRTTGNNGPKKAKA